MAEAQARESGTTSAATSRSTNADIVEGSGQAARHDHDQESGTEGPPKSLPPESPLPWRQLTIICLMRLAEPVAFTLCFPFIGDMLWDLKATTDRGQIGMYAGIVESSFAAVQTLTVLQWGRASDRLGRRPIIISGLIGSSISTLLFGLSKSFWFLVFARCLNGALNGNVVVYKSLIGEMETTNRSNVARAFSLLPLMWAAGCTLGPAIGGYLSRPAMRYPGLFAARGTFGLNGLWEENPYLLPCVVSACITWTSIVLGIFFLEETLPSKVQAKREKQARRKAAKAAQAQRDAPADQRPLLGAIPNGTLHGQTPYGATGQPTPRSRFFERSSEHQRSHRSLRESLLISFHGRESSNAGEEERSQDISEPSRPERPRPRPIRGRSKSFLGHVQSWTSGFTPDGSRDISPVESPVLESNAQLGDEPIAQQAIEEEQLPPKKPEPDGSVMSMLRNAQVRRVMISYSFLSLTSVGIDSVQVLYFWEPITLGGLSFPSTITGTLLSCAGLLGVTVQLLLFPYIQRRIGTLPLYRFCMAIFPLVPLILPLANLAARKGLRKGREDHEEGGFEEDVLPSYRVLVEILIGVAMGLKTIGIMAFSSQIILVNQAAALCPGAQLGTLNGLAQMASSVSRAFGPYAFSSLFSLSLTEQILSGNLIWLIILLVALTGAVQTSGLVDVEKMIDRGELGEDAATGAGRPQ